MSAPLIIASVAVVAFAIRFLPLIGLASFKLPRVVDDWLYYVVIAVLSTIVFQSIFLTEGRLSFGWDFRLAGAAVAIMTALLSQNLLATVTAGTAVVVLLTIFF